MKPKKMQQNRRSFLKRAAAVGAVAAMPAAYVRTGRAAPAVEIRLGSDSPGDHPFNRGLEAFAEALRRSGDPDIGATIFPNAQLGDEPTMMNGLQIGTVDGVFLSSGTLSSVVAEAAIFELPFLFSSVAGAVRAAERELAEILNPRIERATRARIVGWASLGSRNMWNSRRPVRAASDLAGLKMRTQASQIQQDTYSSLGALPVNVAFNELYTALQTGVIDGADVGIPDMLALNLYEVAKHMTMTRHFYLMNAFVLSERLLERLDEGRRRLVLNAARQAPAAMLKATSEQEAEGRSTLAERGMRILDVQDREPFVEAVATVYEKHAGRVGGPELIASLQERYG